MNSYRIGAMSSRGSAGVLSLLLAVALAALWQLSTDHVTRSASAGTTAATAQLRDHPATTQRVGYAVQRGDPAFAAYLAHESITWAAEAADYQTKVDLSLESYKLVTMFARFDEAPRD